MLFDAEEAGVLAHHGIKGQRWHHHKTQEESEDREPTSKGELAVNKPKSPSELLADKKTSTTTKTSGTKTSTLTPEEQQARHDRNVKIAKGAALAAIIIGGSVAAYELKGKDVLSEHTIQSGMIFEKEFAGKAFKKDASLSGKKTFSEIEEIAKKVNPSFGAEGTTQNCRRCTFAQELRRRGFDVEATHTETGLGQKTNGLTRAISTSKLDSYQGEHLISRNFERDFKFDPTSEAFQNLSPEIQARDRLRHGAKISTAIFSELEKQPEGARGELAFTHIGGAP